MAEQLLLGREAILAAADLPHVDVPVPEWEGTVRVRTMTAGERDQFEEWLHDTKSPNEKINLKNFRARLAALTIVDAAGVRVFSEADVEALGAKSAAALDRVVDAAKTLNGLTRKDVKRLVGNSSAAPGDGSSSSSPSASA